MTYVWTIAGVVVATCTENAAANGVRGTPYAGEVALGWIWNAELEVFAPPEPPEPPSP